MKRLDGITRRPGFENCRGSHLHYHIRKTFAHLPTHGAVYSNEGFAVLFVYDEIDPCNMQVLMDSVEDNGSVRYARALAKFADDLVYYGALPV